MKTGEDTITLVQGALRPSVLGAYEYIFPKEALPEVLALFDCLADENVGATPTIMNRMKLSVLRKIFGAKAIPKKIIEEARKVKPTIQINGTQRGINKIVVGGVSIHIVGIKEDEIKEGKFPNGEEWFQEML